MAPSVRFALTKDLKGAGVYSETAYDSNGRAAARFDYRDDGSLSAACTFYSDGELESKFVFRRDGSRKTVRVYRKRPADTLAAKIGYRRAGGCEYRRIYRLDGTPEMEDRFRADGTVESRYLFDESGSRIAGSLSGGNGTKNAGLRDTGVSVPPNGGGGNARRAAWLAVATVGLAFGFGYSHWEGRYPAFSGRDLDCAEIGHQVRVGAADPHGLDRDGDGIGCEAERPNWQGLALVGFGVAALGGWRTVRVFQKT